MTRSPSCRSKLSGMTAEIYRLGPPRGRFAPGDREMTGPMILHIISRVQDGRDGRARPRRARPRGAVVAPDRVRLNLEARGFVTGDRTQRVKGKANEVAGKAKGEAGYQSGKPGTEAQG